MVVAHGRAEQGQERDAGRRQDGDAAEPEGVGQRGARPARGQAKPSELRPVGTGGAPSTREGQRQQEARSAAISCQPGRRAAALRRRAEAAGQDDAGRGGEGGADARGDAERGRARRSAVSTSSATPTTPASRPRATRRTVGREPSSAQARPRHDQRADGAEGGRDAAGQPVGRDQQQREEAADVEHAEQRRLPPPRALRQAAEQRPRAAGRPAARGRAPRAAAGRRAAARRGRCRSCPTRRGRWRSGGARRAVGHGEVISRSRISRRRDNNGTISRLQVVRCRDLLAPAATISRMSDPPGPPTDSVDRIVAAWREARPDLDPSPIGVVGRVSRTSVRLQRRLDEVFAQHGLQPGGFDVLATLRRNGPPFRMSPSQLHRQLMIASGSMTARLDRLEQAGLVAREPDPSDRRALHVVPDAGRLRAHRACGRRPPGQRAAAARGAGRRGARDAGRPAAQAAACTSATAPTTWTSSAGRGTPSPGRACRFSGAG